MEGSYNGDLKYNEMQCRILLITWEEGAIGSSQHMVRRTPRTVRRLMGEGETITAILLAVYKTDLSGDTKPLSSMLDELPETLKYASWLTTGKGVRKALVIHKKLDYQEEKDISVEYWLETTGKIGEEKLVFKDTIATATLRETLRPRSNKIPG